MNKLLKNILIIFFLIVLIIGVGIVLKLLFGSLDSEMKFNSSDSEIKRVWLLENGENVPYFILEETEDNYLLIREHVLEPHEFVYPDAEDSYYANSALDDFLNKEFIKCFSEDMKKYFIESDVEITAKESIGCCGEKTEYIQRIFFIPSYTEVTGKHNSVSLKEGRYLKKLEKVIASTNDKGESVTWWLRTPNTWYFHLVHAIDVDGASLTGMTQDNYRVYKDGVRPMCRISLEAPIIFENE